MINIDPKIEERLKIEIDEKIKKELKTSMFTQTITLVTAAFGIVAALAWNEAVKAWLDRFIKAGQGAYALTYYALIVTIISVIITVILGYVKQRVEK